MHLYTKSSQIPVLMLARQSPFIITPSLSLTLIIRIPDIIAKRLHSPDLLACPFGDVLGGVLDVVHGVVPAILDLVSEAVPAFFDVVGDFFGFADLSLLISMCPFQWLWGRIAHLFTSPVGSVLGEIMHTLFDVILLVLPSIVCRR